MNLPCRADHLIGRASPFVFTFNLHLMKVLAYLSLPLFFLLWSQQSFAQAPPKVVTDTLSVSGVCGMCQARIQEAALYVPGVKLAEWDKKTHQLRVVYKRKRTNKEAICQTIAEAGHDNEGAKAPDAVYAELPGCCRYRDGVESH